MRDYYEYMLGKKIDIGRSKLLAGSFSNCFQPISTMYLALFTLSLRGTETQTFQHQLPLLVVDHGHGRPPAGVQMQSRQNSLESILSFFRSRFFVDRFSLPHQVIDYASHPDLLL